MKSQLKSTKKIIKFLDDNSQKWALGLTYMIDDKYPDKQFEMANFHLQIILDDIKSFLRPSFAHEKERNENIIKLRERGLTLQEIGEICGKSRQRIHQVLKELTKII
jgi:DNA-directed RNA polymerase sigma subunit (sigma70/sigma32)